MSTIQIAFLSTNSFCVSFKHLVNGIHIFLLSQTPFSQNFNIFVTMSSPSPFADHNNPSQLSLVISNDMRPAAGGRLSERIPLWWLLVG